jgi:hypothetical protein
MPRYNRNIGESGVKHHQTNKQTETLSRKMVICYKGHGLQKWLAQVRNMWEIDK